MPNSFHSNKSTECSKKECLFAYRWQDEYMSVSKDEILISIASSAQTVNCLCGSSILLELVYHIFAARAAQSYDALVPQGQNEQYCI